MVDSNLKPSFEEPKKKPNLNDENSEQEFVKDKDGMVTVPIEKIKVVKEGGKFRQVIETTIDKNQEPNGEDMWFENNKENYEILLHLYNKLSTNLHINVESVSILRDLENVLGKLIYTTNIERFEPSAKVCMMLANLIYKTTKPDNLNDSQLAAISECLSYVIEENCSVEDYFEASRKLIKAKLNWLTGDKEYM